MYIYESCLGGLYVDGEDLPYEDLFDEASGDCDLCIGYAETREDAKWVLIDFYEADSEWVEERYSEFLDVYFDEDEE